MSPEHVDARARQRGVGDLQYYNGEMHRAVFALPNYVKQLLSFP